MFSSSRGPRYALSLFVTLAGCKPPSRTPPASEVARVTPVAPVPAPASPALPAPQPAVSCAAVPAGPPVRAAAAISDATSISRRARVCLEDASCPVAEVQRLFVAADDAHEPLEECFRFLDGAGPTRDEARGRACLERQLARAGACEGGGSSDWARAQLATLWIDGAGGPVCIPQARALLAGCFADVTKIAVLAHADARESDAATAPLDLCRDGATTLVGAECQANRAATESAQSALRAKALVPLLDDEGKRLLDESTKAYADYAKAMGEFAYEVYIDGTVREIVALGRTRAIVAAREADLETFAQFQAKDRSDAVVARAQRSVATALAAVTTSTKGERDALAMTQSTWTRYRAAEIALYEHTFGPTQGAARVRATVAVHLDERRAKDCAAPSLADDP